MTHPPLRPHASRGRRPAVWRASQLATACLVLVASMAALAAPASAATAQPTGGYAFSDSFETGGPTYDFQDISTTGTSVPVASNSDDGVSPAVPIGFDFPFYGALQPNVYVSTNGFLTFDASLSSGGNYISERLPSSNVKNAIAGAWTDLYTGGLGPQSVVSQTLGTAPNRVFVVQFTNVAECCDATPRVTMEFKLFEGSGNIEVQYQHVAVEYPASAGIDNADGLAGVNYFGPQPMSFDNVAVRYTAANSDPVLTDQPDATLVNPGDAATLTAAVTSTPAATVQWQRSTDHGLSYADVPGATSTSYVHTAAANEDGYRYRAVFTNGGNPVTSSSAELQLLPSVTAQPQSTGVYPSQTATFSLTPDANPNVAGIQWQSAPASAPTSFTDISGETGTSLTVTTDLTMNGNVYRAVLSNSRGSTTTDPATLTVFSAPRITAQPADQATNDGGIVTFHVASDDPSYTTQWEVDPGSGTFAPVSGATSNDLTFPATLDQNGSRYQAVLTDTNGSTTSQVAGLTVTPNAPAITTQPTDQTVGSGNTATFTTGATSNPPPTVQWQSKPSGGSFTDVPGATATSYTTPALAYADSGTQYRAVFTNGGGATNTSPATVTVTALAPAVTTQPADQTVGSGGTASFYADASGDPAPTVQWQRSTAGGAFTDLPGETGQNLTVTVVAADSGNAYRAVFTNVASTATSQAATLTVNPSAPVVTTDPQDQTVTSGTQANFTASASGDPVPTVQWQVSTDGGNAYADLPGATSTTLSLTTTPAMDKNQYRAAFVNSGGQTQTAPALLTVNHAPIVTTQPTDQTVATGNPATFTAQADGRPAPSVQWQRSTDGGSTFTAITGATLASYTTPATSATDSGTRYRAVFANSVDSATSTPALLTVTVPPSAPLNVRASQTGPGQITITWDAPTDAGTSRITGYDVGYGNGGSGNGATFGASERRAVFSGLTNGSYTASVAAQSAAGVGQRSTVPVTVVAGQPPAAAACAPAGPAFALRQVPSSMTVHRGAIIYTRGTLTQAGKPCAGYRLGVYAKRAKVTAYSLQAGIRTDTTGSAHFAFQAAETLRFGYHLTLSPTKGLWSAISELVVR